MLDFFKDPTFRGLPAVSIDLRSLLASTMNTDKARLEKMLREHKISQDDYQILMQSLKRKSFFEKLNQSWLLNPFQKIAGWQALILGIALIVITSYLGIQAKLYYLAPLSAINAVVLAKQNISHLFLFLLYQNLVNWLFLAMGFMLITKLLQKNKVRAIDFLGTVSLAHFPVLLTTAYTGLLRRFYPSLLDVDMSQGLQIHFSAAQYIISIPFVIFMVWQGVLYFYAFKESSGLNGKKLWLGFLGALMVVSMFTQPLTTLLMN